MQIKLFNRKNKKIEIEKVYKEQFLLFLYKGTFFSNIFLNFFSRILLFSKIYGFLQKRRFSRKKIKPFIKKFQINEDEFLEKDFSSFYDFFVRKLKKESRPIEKKSDIAISPCDGRCLVFPDIKKAEGFYVKGKKFNLENFLKDEKLSAKYQNGSMAICRLAPSDYHRFHFIDDCFCEKSSLIKGYLYSVNPIALKKNIEIFCENKRMITLLKTKHFGDVLYVEVGASNVGSIVQTYFVGDNKKKDEKGYFGLGGSSILILFEKDKIKFDKDLLENSKKYIETKILMGESLGKAI